jgi:ADP-ribose pyrophosphatase YjhB (NUDIX family)
MIPDARKFCPFCGSAYGHERINPRTCASSTCGLPVWDNPLPVGILLQPVDDGIVVVRRGIEPKRGSWACPGGYLTLGESWQQGTVREAREEINLIVDPADVVSIDAISPPPESRTLLICGLSRRILREKDLPPFIPNEEALDRRVIHAPEELAFPSHTELVRRFFAGEFRHLYL